MIAPENIIGLRPAAERAGVSHQAIVYWIEKHGIGQKVDGEWHIDVALLDQVVQARKFLKLRQA